MDKVKVCKIVACNTVLRSLSSTLGQEGVISCSLIVRVFYIHFLVHWDKREWFLVLWLFVCSTFTFYYIGTRGGDFLCFDCSCVLHSLSNTLGHEGAIYCSLIVRVFYIHFLVHWDKREWFIVLWLFVCFTFTF